jgi:hypothetical protein
MLSKTLYAVVAILAALAPMSATAGGKQGSGVHNCSKALLTCPPATKPRERGHGPVELHGHKF